MAKKGGVRSVRFFGTDAGKLPFVHGLTLCPLATALRTKTLWHTLPMRLSLFSIIALAAVAIATPGEACTIAPPTPERKIAEGYRAGTISAVAVVPKPTVANVPVPVDRGRRCCL